MPKHYKVTKYVIKIYFWLVQTEAKARWGPVPLQYLGSNLWRSGPDCGAVLPAGNAGGRLDGLWEYGCLHRSCILHLQRFSKTWHVLRDVSARMVRSRFCQGNFLGLKVLIAFNNYYYYFFFLGNNCSRLVPRACQVLWRTLACLTCQCPAGKRVTWWWRPSPATNLLSKHAAAMCFR